MCNDYRQNVDLDTILDDFAELTVDIRMSEGRPNLEPRDDIRITDRGPIVRGVSGERGVGDLVQRRWSWPGPNKAPVYVMRSEGRDFATGRCLILADGFYEFTAPMEPGKKRKDKWLFTKAGERWFAIAGILRPAGDLGEAFAMLTLEPGPDIAPYHNRGVAVLQRRDWIDWLDPSVPASDVLRPLPAGSLNVEQVG